MHMIISKQNVKKCHSQGSLPGEFRWIPNVLIFKFHISVLFLVFLQKSLINNLSITGMSVTNIYGTKKKKERKSNIVFS